MAVQLSTLQTSFSVAVALPSSKSESNRVLLIDALCKHQTQQNCQLQNLSAARDTQTMQRLLATADTTLDVIDAGTTMRFLTAFCAITNRKATLTGTARMCERPIALLVEALQALGATINYEQKQGFPPIEIVGFLQKQAAISIRGDVSSQYISALLMVAPLLPDGLRLTLTGEVHSRPYIEMTITLMQQFGVEVQWQDQTLYVAPQIYKPTTYWVESDWSAASYWYAIAALATDCNIFLEGLKPQSLQGDSVVVEIGEYFGVKSEFKTNGVQLSKMQPKSLPSATLDWSHCPDLAQTFAVLAAATGKELYLTGLQSLRIKETDRIAALQNELQNFGIQAVVKQENTLYIAPQNLQKPLQPVQTYKDHRMAMAFAPLALCLPITIANEEVVEKSYPHFWKDLEKIMKILNFEC